MSQVGSGGDVGFVLVECGLKDENNTKPVLMSERTYTLQ